MCIVANNRISVRKKMAFLLFGVYSGNQHTFLGCHNALFPIGQTTFQETVLYNANNNTALYFGADNCCQHSGIDFAVVER